MHLRTLPAGLTLGSNAATPLIESVTQPRAYGRRRAGRRRPP